MRFFIHYSKNVINHMKIKLSRLIINSFLIKIHKLKLMKNSNFDIINNKNVLKLKLTKFNPYLNLLFHL